LERQQKRIPSEFKEKYAHFEWRAMAGMRDKLIHDYLGIDYDIVWDVVIDKIPLDSKVDKKIFPLVSTFHYSMYEA